MADQTSPPPTIVESFGQSLPEVPRAKASYERQKSRTTSTIGTRAPLVLYWQSPQEIEMKANHVLESNEIKSSFLNERRLPAIPAACRLDTEGDVVFNSALFNVLPCLEVLRCLYPGKWSVHSERSEGLIMANHDFDQDLLNKAKEEDGENYVEKKPAKPPSKKNTVRYDLIIKTLPKGNESGKTIAVIEYKRPGMIRYSDYKRATLDLSATSDDIQKSRKFARDQETETCLAHNGAMYTKQANKYAQQTQCSHVAIFNWDHLQLYNFPLGSFEDRKDMKTMLTWVTEADSLQEVDQIHVKHIRKILLGWLLMAFEAHFDSSALAK